MLGAEGCSITQHPAIVSLPSILSKYQKLSIWRNLCGRERGGLGALRSGFPNSAQHSFPQKIRSLASREKPQGLGAFGTQGKLEDFNLSPVPTPSTLDNASASGRTISIDHASFRGHYICLLRSCLLEGDPANGW